MKEQVVTIGDADQIIGVLSPSIDAGNANKPMVLILNSGLLNRTGPFRLHVTLSRNLANIGFNAFRFDLSGIGDSDRSHGKLNKFDQHLVDIQSVMDYFSADKGVREFIVAGICTGADYAHKCMLLDDRVKAAVCIDGYSYATFRYHLNYYLPRVFSYKVWVNQFKKLISRLPAQHRKRNEDPITRLFFRWSVPPKEKTHDDYRSIIEQNLKMLCVFTASWPYNYKNQHSDAFRDLDFGKNIQVEFLDKVEHTFPMVEDRNRLNNVIINWFKSEFDEVSQA